MSTTSAHLARLGAVASTAGAVLLLVSTLLHPLDTDPNDALAAFAEYAADSFYVWSHIGQFAGMAVLGMALLAFAATIEPGRAAAWARIGCAGAVASVALAAMLQAVDGVALKATVSRWMIATGDARAFTFEAALAVRQIEIGLASFLSLLFGLTLIAFGLATFLSERYPRWLGGLGLLGGVGMVVAGLAQAATGFSDLAMTVSMLASLLLLAWVVLAGVLMWRLSPRLTGDDAVRELPRSTP